MTKPSVIILHGWGLGGSTYERLAALLETRGFSVYAPDLPGFGAEPLQKQEINLDDYVRFVKNFMKKKKLTKVILLGHSFGGRVSVKFAVKFPDDVYALLLTGVPGIKQKLSLRQSLMRYFAIRLGAAFPIRALSPLRGIVRKGLYFLVGEWDYYNAGDLQETFKKIVTEDLAPYLTKIKTPTLLIWGEKDHVVPLSVGLQMEKLIPQAKLIVVKNYGHKLPYEGWEKFVTIIHNYLKNI